MLQQAFEPGLNCRVCYAHITVCEEQVHSLCGFDPLLTGDTNASSNRIADDPAAKTPGLAACVVFGTIVHDNHFQIPMGGRPHRL